MSLTSAVKGEMKSLDSIDELFSEEIKDLYDVENVLLDALPKMAESASAPELKQAFQEHLDTTQRQKSRLDEIFRLLGQDAEAGHCDGIRGIVSEGEVFVHAKGDAAVKDAALIGAAQRAEHYEMAGYGMARSLARRIGRTDIADILQQTLDEEGETDHRLTDIAEGNINPRATAS